MNSASATAETTSSHPADAGSWWGVLFVLVVLALMIGAIVAVWSLSLPAAPSGLERYVPLVNGTTLTLRVTQANGAIHYESLNVERVRASEAIAEMGDQAGAGLLKMLGIDVLTAAPKTSLDALGKTPIAIVQQVVYGRGELVTRTQSVYWGQARALYLLNSGDLEFSPPALSIGDPTQLGQTLTRKGLVTLDTNSADYTVSSVIEAREALTTPVGRLSDCLRVRVQFQILSLQTDVRDWYCAGVGFARREEKDAVTGGVNLYELIAVSAPDFIAHDEASLPPPTRPQMQEEERLRVFPDTGPVALSVNWSVREPRTNSGVTTTPVVADDLILYGSLRGTLMAVDRQRQKIRWRFQTGGSVYSMPTVANGIVYFGSSDRRLYALDAQSGALRWAYRTQDAISSSPAVSAGLVLVGSEDRVLYALDALSGREQWRFEASGPIISSPVVADGVVYVGADDSALYALDVKTGEARWAYAAGDAITAAPVVQDGVVYVGAYDQQVYALKAQTKQAMGEVLWHVKLKDEVFDRVVVHADKVYVTAGKTLYAFNAANGAEVWRYRTGGSLFGVPLLMGERLYINTATGVLTLDVRKGKELEVARLSESARNAGLGSDGQLIYIGYWDGIFQALGGR